MENQSLTIVDNVKRTLDEFDSQKFEYKTIIQVVSWYAQRRAWCTLKKFAPEDTKIVRVNTTDNSPDLEKSTWYQSRKGIELVFNEFVKLKLQSILNSA